MEMKKNEIDPLLILTVVLLGILNALILMIVL